METELVQERSCPGSPEKEPTGPGGLEQVWGSKHPGYWTEQSEQFRPAWPTPCATTGWRDGNWCAIKLVCRSVLWNLSPSSSASIFRYRRLRNTGRHATRGPHFGWKTELLEWKTA